MNVLTVQELRGGAMLRNCEHANVLTCLRCYGNEMFSCGCVEICNCVEERKMKLCTTEMQKRMYVKERCVGT